MELSVPREAAGQQVRIFLRDAVPLEPVGLLRRLVSSGKVLVEGKPCPPKRVLRAGESVVVLGLAAERETFVIASISPDVLYEDDDLLVLNKPAGCTVVRKRNAEHCAFQTGILEYLRRSPEAAQRAARERYRPRALHRLDRDTTGAVIEAKTRAGELCVARQFQDRKVKKEYLAVVRGEPAEDSGAMEEPIGPVAGDLTRMQIRGQNAKASLTTYDVLERFRGFAYVRVLLHTGRRHQIRVHFAHAGHPVAADALYGGGDAFLLSSVKRRYKVSRGESEKPVIARPALHAHAVTFLPVGAVNPVRVESPVPADMQLLLKVLRKYA